MDKDYLLGTSETELERLGFQHQVWQRETAGLIRRAGFGHGQRLIDFGCGPGLVSMELARLVGPTGFVLAVDSAQRFLDACARRSEAEALANIELLKQDAADFSPASESFDGAFLRWLLCFLDDPEPLLENLYQALKPGGAIAVVDYYNYAAVSVEPKDDAIQRIFRAYADSAQASCYGFEVGGVLSGLLAHIGFQIEASDCWVRTDRPGSNLWQWVTLFHQSYGPGLVESGFMTEAEMDAFWMAWKRASEDPCSLFSSPPMLAFVARKPG